MGRSVARDDTLACARTARRDGQGMTAEQIEEVQAMPRPWRPGTPLPTRSRTGVSA
jgi:hypothetical protein